MPSCLFSTQAFPPSKKNTKTKQQMELLSARTKPMDNPDYYLRYNKSFHRMGGQMRYLSADNRDFLLALAKRLAK